MALENRLYTEEELVNINTETPLTPLEYYTHHEDLKGEYEKYCIEHCIPMDDNASADSFQMYLEEREDNNIEN